MIKVLPVCLFFASALCFVVCIGCSPGGSEKMEKLKFVFITTCVNEDFFKPVQKGMHDAAALMHAECTFIGTEGVDAAAQAKMMDSVLQLNVDGIAVNLIDSAAFDAVVEKAITKGIPVVAFNSDDTYTQNARLSSVCQNLYLAGQQFGKALSDDLPDNSQVIITVHSDGISALEERVRGIKNALQHKNLDYVRVVTTNIIDSATAVLQKTISAHPGAKMILCTGLADTEAAGNVIGAKATQPGLQAAGFDLSENILQHIENGNLLFTIDQQPYMQGFMPVIQLTQFKRYGILPSSNEIGAAFVKRENIESVRELTRKGYR